MDKNLWGTNSEYGSEIRQTYDGGYIIVGYTGSYGAGSDDVYLIKTDSDGDTLWTKTYGATYLDRGFSVDQTADSGYIISGRFQDQDWGDVYLIRTDSDGDTLWTKTYGGSGNHPDEGHMVRQTLDGGYIVAGRFFGADSYDIYLIKTDADGDTIWTKTYGGSTWDIAYGFQQTVDGGYVIIGNTDSYGAGLSDVWLLRLTPDLLLTDDDEALAFNGNRHLVRKPNTETLHLVYVMEGHILYTYTTNGGTVWQALENLGAGESPAIALDVNGNPCVTWIKKDTLVYTRKDPTQGWEYTKHTFGTAAPSHPTIMVPPLDEAPDSVRILVRLKNSGMFAYTAITEVYFPLASPQNKSTRNIELDQADSLDFPSLAYDYEKTLHATYTCEDTVRYAFRAADTTNWTVRSDPFYPDGDYSGHPFVETYGDSVFIVWQCAADTEVWRGAKLLDDNIFEKWNISVTSSTPSIFPVNASGFATVFSDKTPSLSYYDIFWRSYPDSQLQNLSNTSSIQSIYTQADLMISQEAAPRLYVGWQEGNAIPYAIEFTSTDLTERSFPDHQSIPAYYVTTPGNEIPSRHLAERDSFISTWQIPVDVGKQGIAYKFRLDPNYIYELSATAYHEYHNTWIMDVLIDQEGIGKIEYAYNEPMTLDLLIKPEFYQDSIIDVMFKTTEGKFSALASLNIYRYEGKTAKQISPENGNTQGHEISWLNTISVYPSLFNEQLHVQYQCTRKQDLAIQIFDICGRIIREITPNSQATAQGLSTCIWNGTDNQGEKVAAGVYFIRIADTKTGTSACCKVLKID